jgi:hypothetical protein
MGNMYGLDDSADTAHEFECTEGAHNHPTEDQQDPRHVAEQEAKLDEAFGTAGILATTPGLLSALGVLAEYFGIDMEEPTATVGQAQCAAEPFLSTEDVFTLADVVLLVGASISGGDTQQVHALMDRVMARQTRLHVGGVKGFDAHLRDLAERLASLGTDMFSGRTTGLHKGAF